MAKEESLQESTDLLFAWLSPIESKRDRRMHASTNVPASSPLVNKARSAIRKTVRASHVNSLKKSAKSKVKEAKDACLWLRAAGFPQYVQMFEDGLFPINLSKFQVEKDHSFLEPADMDSLLRRLNTLNRCAGIMEDIYKKGNDSDDETNFRALSSNWQFRRKQKKWLRRKERKDVSSNQEALYSSNEDLLLEQAMENGTPTDHSPLMMVSELRNSLTGLDRAVKTYSFMMNDDQLPVIQVESPIPGEEGTKNTRLLDLSSKCSSFDSEDDGGWQSDAYPSGGMDNFATGIIDTFESNLLKLKEFNSLPDVFQAVKSLNEDVSTDNSPLSSASVSTTSIMDASDLVYQSQESPGRGSHPVYPKGSPPLPMVGMNGTGSLKDEATITDECNLTSNTEDDECKTIDDYNRGGSADSSLVYRSESPVGSEYSEKSQGGTLFQPVVVRRPVSNSVLNGSSKLSPVPNDKPNPLLNGDEPSLIGDTSPKRISRSSVTSAKYDGSLRRHEPKWHSYQRPHSFRGTFKPVRTLIPIEELSAGQISVLRKLSLVKLTALIEYYNQKSKSNIARMLKRKKQKVPDAKGKILFGVPLSVYVRRTGQVLPPAILHAMKYLKEGRRLETMGLFRRAASKARVDILREIAEANSDSRFITDFSPYDIADMIKLYYRELPEPILTSKLSEMLILVQENVPSQLRLPALQAVMLLMPDENREALQVLLLFLQEVSEHSDVNQMTAQNLAVCFAPTLFCLSSPQQKTTSSLGRMGSFKRNTVGLSLSPTQLASNKEVIESVASSHCLTQMILQADKLFKVAADMLQVCRFTHIETGDPVPYYELGLDRSGSGNLYSYLDRCIQTVLREARKKFKNWIHFDSVGGIEVSYLKVRDGIPLWVWRGVVEVEAPASLAHQRLWTERYLWDSKMVAPKLVTKIDEQTEIFQYVTPSTPPLNERDHCLLRSWQYDVSSGSYVFVSTTVSHPLASLHGGIRAMQLVNFYLVEPLDSGRSRLTYICRVDMRGRSAEYYNKAYGPYLATTIGKIKDVCVEHNIQETAV